MELNPWQWSETDKGSSVKLSSNCSRVLFHEGNSLGCSAVMGNLPFGKCMEHYFEVEMYRPFHGNVRMVGITTHLVPLETFDYCYQPLIGQTKCSFGLNYNGKAYHNGQTVQVVKESDVDIETLEKITIGVLYDAFSNTISFLFNGCSYGTIYRSVDPSMQYYPIVCSTARNSVIQLTVCRSTVATLKNLCRAAIRKYTIGNQIQGDEHVLNSLPLPPQLLSYLNFSTYEAKPDEGTIRKETIV